jgi:hypothetical protein
MVYTMPADMKVYVSRMATMAEICRTAPRSSVGDRALRTSNTVWLCTYPARGEAKGRCSQKHEVIGQSSVLHRAQ